MTKLDSAPPDFGKIRRLGEYSVLIFCFILTNAGVIEVLILSEQIIILSNLFCNPMA